MRRGSGAVVNTWRAKAKTHPWATSTRVFKTTALELAELANPSGIIRVPRDLVAARLGLPRRTVDHHFKRLIQMGWIVRVRPPVARGPNAGPAEFRLTVPDDDKPEVACDEAVDGMQPATDQLPPITCKFVACSLDSANARERVAVEDDALINATTSTLASDQLKAYARATAQRKEQTQPLIRGEYRGGPVAWKRDEASDTCIDILDLISDDYENAP